MGDVFGKNYTNVKLTVQFPWNLLQTLIWKYNLLLSLGNPNKD